MSAKHPTSLEVLKGARDLLADPERWCKGAFALDAHGNLLADGFEPGACKWCLAGAIEKISGRSSMEYEPALGRLNRIVQGSANTPITLVSWHDEEERTHAEVLALLDAAIRLEAA